MSDLFIAAQETTSIDSSTYDFFCFPFFALSFPQYNLNPSILLERAPSREHSAFSILSHLWFITFISCSFFFFLYQCYICFFCLSFIPCLYALQKLVSYQMYVFFLCLSCWLFLLLLCPVSLIYNFFAYNS